MDLTEEQRRLQASAIEFARQALAYDVALADADGSFGREA
jgi:hypothetical protein